MFEMFERATDRWRSMRERRLFPLRIALLPFNMSLFSNILNWIIHIFYFRNERFRINFCMAWLGWMRKLCNAHVRTRTNVWIRLKLCHKWKFALYICLSTSSFCYSDFFLPPALGLAWSSFSAPYDRAGVCKSACSGRNRKKNGKLNENNGIVLKLHALLYMHSGNPS